MRGIGVITTALASAEGSAPPKWVLLLLFGKNDGRDGRGPYVASAATAPQIIARTAKLAKGVDLVIDYDHQTDLGAVKGVGGTAPAAGWVKELQARADGIWGRVEWTPKGTEVLRNREYRYLSPVLLHDKAGNVLALARAALTNNPNLVFTALAASQDWKELNMEPIASPAILAALNLPETADEAAVIAAIAALRSPAPKVDHASVNAVATVLASMNAERLALGVQRAEGKVNTAIASGSFPPALRDWALALCKADEARFDEFVGKIGTSFSQLFQASHASALPGAGIQQQATPEEEAVARQLGIEAASLRESRS